MVSVEAYTAAIPFIELVGKMSSYLEMISFLHCIFSLILGLQLYYNIEKKPTFQNIPMFPFLLAMNTTALYISVYK